MKSIVRFGRRMDVPSTIQIKHDLRALRADDDIRSLCAEAEGLPAASSWDVIGTHRAAIEAAR